MKGQLRARDGIRFAGRRCGILIGRTPSQRLGLIVTGLGSLAAACGPDPEGVGVIDQQIFLGTPSAPATRPSAAAVLFSTTDGRTGRCSGTAIAPLWVLTARHCVDDPADNLVPQPQYYQVVVGRQDLAGSDGEVAGAADVIVNYSDDLALIQLDRAVSVPVSRLLSPARVAEVPYGSEVVIAGFGLTNGSPDPSDVLLEASVSILGQGADCDHVMLNDKVYIIGPLRSTRVCLGNVPYDSVIGSGDSGGPSWVLRDGEWFLAAVNSASTGYFTESVWVPDFFDWALENAPGQHPSYLPASQIAATM